MALQVLINGVDRSAHALLSTLTIQSILSSSPDTASFTMRLPATALNEAPDATNELIIRDDGAKVFAGRIIQAPRALLVNNAHELQVAVSAQDYQLDANRDLVVGDFATTANPRTAGEIVTKYIHDYLRRHGIQPGSIEDGPTFEAWPVNYQPVGDAINHLARIVGFDWFVDYDKRLHFFSTANALPDAEWDLTQDATAPYALSAPVDGVSLKIDITQLRNQVTVRGASGISDIVTQKTTATGVETSFALNYGDAVPGSLTMTIAGVAQLVGEDGKIDPNVVDWLVDYSNGVVFAAPGTSPPNSGSIVQLQYRYSYRLIVQAADADSIARWGTWQHIVVNDAVTNRGVAVQVAKAELREYAAPATTLSYRTTRPGLRVGVRQRVTLPLLGVDGVFRIRTVTLKYDAPTVQDLAYQPAGVARSWGVQAERIPE